MAYDVGIAIVLVLITWRGSRKGFVWQLATIAALVLAFCFAGPLSGKLAPLTGLKSPLDRWVSLAVLYLGFSFGCFLVARGLRTGIEKIKFEDYDRHLGAIFGLLKGGLMCLVGTFFAVTLWPQSHAFILGSYSGYAAAIVFDELRPIVPDEYHGYLDGSLKKLGQCGLDPDNPFCPLEELGFDHHHDDEAHEHAGEDGHEHDAAGGSESPVPADRRLDQLFGLLRGLPADEADSLQGSIERTIAEADEGHRESLLRELEAATPATIASVLERWGRTAPTDGQGSAGAPLTDLEKQQRRDLLFDIARLYTQFPAAQQSIIDEVAELLRGVPPRVQLQVIRDWQADLRNSGDDPDRETTAGSPLDQRIERQLRLARVPLESLDQALRDRLATWR